MKKNRKLLLTAELLFLAGISNVVLLPHVMEQWSHDRLIGVLHLLLGLFTGTVGIGGIVLLVRQEFVWHKKRWQEGGLRLFAGYVVAQFLLGALLGGIGLFIFQAGILDYEDTKNLIYLSAGIFQNLIRVFFLFHIMNLLYGRDWRENQKLLGTAEAAALALSAVTVCLGILPAGKVTEIIRILWNVIFVTGYIGYFRNVLYEEGKR